MTRMLDILEDYCRIRDYSYCRIDGNTTGWWSKCWRAAWPVCTTHMCIWAAGEDRDRQIEEFNSPTSGKQVEKRNGANVHLEPPALSFSCCPPALAGWASTLPPLTLSYCTTPTGTHRWGHLTSCWVTHSLCLPPSLAGGPAGDGPSSPHRTKEACQRVQVGGHLLSGG